MTGSAEFLAIVRGEKKAALAAGGLVGGVLSMSCCLLPLALAVLGVSGAWIGALTSLAPYQPIFVLASLGLVAGGFWSVYRRPKDECAPGSHCARPRSDRVVKGALWMATLMIAASVGTDLVAPLLL